MESAIRAATGTSCGRASADFRRTASRCSGQRSIRYAVRRKSLSFADLAFRPLERFAPRTVHAQQTRTNVRTGMVPKSRAPCSKDGTSACTHQKLPRTSLLTPTVDTDKIPHGSAGMATTSARRRGSMIPAKARSNRVALVEVTVTGSDRNHKQRTGFPLVVATEKTARPQLVSCGHAVKR